MPATQDLVDVAENAHPPSRPTSKATVPQWLPVSLLAVTSATLIVPIVLLRRYRANAVSKSLQNSSAPPRRSGSLPGHLSPVRPVQPSPAISQRNSEQNADPTADETFNAALYTAKAFGFATIFVTVGAVSVVWGVKNALGVETPQEFGHRMRSAILAKIPGLSARLHRPPDTSYAYIVDTSESRELEWSWPDAEKRLKGAFERGGLSGWAVAAIREVEAEARAERAKRETNTVGKD